MITIYTPKDSVDAISRLETVLTQRMNQMSAELDALQAAVARIDERGDAILTYVANLSEQLRQMANSATELSTLKAALQEQAAKLDQQSADFDAVLNPPT